MAGTAWRVPAVGSSRVRAALVVVAVVMSLLVGTRPAAAAVPTCRDLGRISTGSHAWMDNHSQTSPLVVNIDRLVCSAANYAYVDIKSWFIKVDGPAMRHLLADLKLMVRYHHVKVG